MTLEGIDGAGKTSLAKAIYERLTGQGIPSVLTGEPTRTWLGDAVRRGIDEGFDPLVQALLFLADRSLHVPKIEEWLSEGKVVLCDRYHDSTVAYQSVALEGRVPRPTEWLNRIASPVLIKPDLTLLLVVDPREGLSRVSSIRSRTRYEEIEFLTKVQQTYLRLAKGPRFVRLDGSRPLEAVVKEAVKAVLSRLQG